MVRSLILLVLGVSAAQPQDLDAFVTQASQRFTPKPRRFSFGLIGDQQYNAEQEAKFPRVIDAMNREKLRFVTHDGDTKSGESACSDATFANRLAVFQRSIHPFILTPGDNDWTDCGAKAADHRDPRERLAHIRKLFYPQPERSLGQRKLALLPQSSLPAFRDFVENAMWAEGEVLFATLHIVGTNNNLAQRAEFGPRNQANLFWLRAAFAIAKQRKFRALMLIMQANPKFEERQRPAADGFGEMIRLLEKETIAFPGQVVMVHGDSHYFRIDKPLAPTPARIENFTRVETFGPPDVHWVRATVDPRNPMIFVFEQRIVSENIVKR
ncbi:MAG: hypothetical protein K2X03_01085 [Bryobacteraceae bacterium]|nr:hypothetical protein [Bryobacteraceae bacterium]